VIGALEFINQRSSARTHVRGAAILVVSLH
jgi:hypothetical protein